MVRDLLAPFRSPRSDLYPLRKAAEPMLHDTADMDIVYVVRPGPLNEELRYSLRSLVNFPHRRVVVVGGRPPWLNQHRSHFMFRRQLGSKYQNSHGNLELAVHSKAISDPFVLFHDDFFVLEPQTGLSDLHRGKTGRILAMMRDRGLMGAYFAGMTETKAILEYYGIPDPLCYEVHAPWVIDKGKWLEAQSLSSRIRRPGIQCLQLRTFYGNYFHVAGEQVIDFKIQSDLNTGEDPSRRPYLSTTDALMRSHTRVRRYLAARFPQPSRYER